MSFGGALLPTAKTPLKNKNKNKNTILLTLLLHKGSVIFLLLRLKARGFDSNKVFKTRNLHCFSVHWLPGQGLICTRPNTMALRAPFATGSSPSNETFWLCLPTLLLGNPWVACSYSVVFSFSLPPLSHSHSCWRHTNTVLLRRKSPQLP